MTPQNIADTLDAIPCVKATRIIELINPEPSEPSSVEATLPGDYAVLITPQNGQYEIQFENRPSARHRFDDTDYHGDPITVSNMDEVVCNIKIFTIDHH